MRLLIPDKHFKIILPPLIYVTASLWSFGVAMGTWEKVAARVIMLAAMCWMVGTMLVAAYKFFKRFF